MQSHYSMLKVRNFIIFWLAYANDSNIFQKRWDKGNIWWNVPTGN